MAKYRVLELSYINDQLVQPDTEIEFDGIPGPNLEPADKAAEKAAAKFAEATSEDVKRFKAAANGGESFGEIDPVDLERQKAAADTGSPEVSDSLL